MAVSVAVQTDGEYRVPPPLYPGGNRGPEHRRTLFRRPCVHGSDHFAASPVAKPSRYRPVQPPKSVSATSAVLGDLCVTKKQPHRPMRYPRGTIAVDQPGQRGVCWQVSRGGEISLLCHAHTRLGFLGWLPLLLDGAQHKAAAVGDSPLFVTVESRRGAVSLSDPFPLPAHQTGRADFPHPAFRLAS